MAGFGFDMTKALTIAGGIVGVVVVAAIVANLLPDFFGAAADINENLTNTSVTTGDATADNLKEIFPIIIGITFLFAIVSVILAAVQFSKR